ncbi:MAG: hypothetical protein HY078_11960 [Elusimicrobia bacterium]|nr:hypothetical protein [Elusimicrobiota bacterium]
MRALMLAAILPASFARAAEPAVSENHPVMRRILEKGRLGPAVPCVEALADEYSKIASVERNEVGFIQKEMRDGTCRVTLLSEGGEAEAHVAPEKVDEASADPDAAELAVVHTHPLNRLRVFADAAYQGDEIMFNDAAAVARRRLSPADFQRQIEEASRGAVPAFGMTPPSLWDLQIVAQDGRYHGDGPRRTVAIVLTPAGYWTYWASDRAKASRGVQDLNQYGQIYEAAVSPTARDLQTGRHARGKQLYENLLRAPAVAELLNGWGEASLSLRAPYSKDAFDRHLAGDGAALRAEYAEKLRQAGTFCRLLATLGVSATFTPFAR